MADDESKNLDQQKLEKTPDKTQLQDEKQEESQADKGKKRKLSKEEKKEAKDKKLKVTAKQNVRLAEKLRETFSFVRNGLRHVTPYYFTFTTHCRPHWVGRKLLEIFTEELSAETAEYYEKSIKSGKITVNGEAAGVDTILKDKDVVCNKIHRHEPPVTSEALEIIESNEDVFVINKPSSIPVQPCGPYRHNTVLFLLGREKGLADLHIVHRMDRMASGLIIFAKTSRKATKIRNELTDRRIEKEYICRVEEDFPSEPIDCQQPILVVSHKIGVCRVSPEGKTCRTVFTKLHGDGKSSVVQCIPDPDRMHQIRVHLQWLGYPIIDDPIYNSPVWGTNKGKGGVTDDEALKVIQALAESNTIIDPDTTENTSDGESLDEDDIPLDQRIARRKEQSLFVRDEDCSECKIRRRDPTPAELTLSLHAICYKGPDWEYRTSQPSWTVQDY